MFAPGDVIRFYSDVADKKKFHICVTMHGCFFFLNSAKGKTFPGDLIFPSSELPFIPATPSGDSIISCSMVIRMTDNDLRRLRAKRVGAISVSLMRQLVAFVENTVVLSDADKEEVLDGLGDWCG